MKQEAITTDSQEAHICKALQLSEIKVLVTSFLIDELIPGGMEDTPIDAIHFISEGVLDSMASLRLVAFLETTFDITVQVHQMNGEHLDTLDQIAAMVMSNTPHR